MEFFEKYGAMRATRTGDMGVFQKYAFLEDYQEMLKTGKTLDGSRELTDDERSQIRTQIEKWHRELGHGGTDN